jgi:hypothetical protein
MLTGYLAGPIENCTINGAVNWRLHVAQEFNGLIHFHNPMCGKEEIVMGKRLIRQENYAPSTRNLTKSDSIFGRDLAMINDSSFLFINLLRATRFPKGTIFEMGFGYAKGKLLVVVASDPAITEHPFISRSSVLFTSLEDSFEFLHSLAKDFQFKPLLER